MVAARPLGLPEPEETEQTFGGNALVKARAAADAAGLIALADDSGLSVTALAGAPGIYSARWAGPDRDFGHAMALVERDWRRPERRPHRLVHQRAGGCMAERTGGGGRGPRRGRLTFPPRGDKGFGYDPIFLPESEALTFGEMDEAAKDRFSHRSRAFAKLKAAVFD